MDIKSDFKVGVTWRKWCSVKQYYKSMLYYLCKCFPIICTYAPLINYVCCFDVQPLCRTTLYSSLRECFWRKSRRRTRASCGGFKLAHPWTYAWKEKMNWLQWVCLIPGKWCQSLMMLDGGSESRSYCYSYCLPADTKSSVVLLACQLCERIGLQARWVMAVKTRWHFCC